MSDHKQTSFKNSEFKDIQISAYKNCTAKTSKPVSLEKVFAHIKSGEGFKDIVSKLRASQSTKEKDELKKQLPAVTVSGLFTGERKTDKLTTHSGLIQIDIDKPKDKAALKEKLKADVFSLAVFDSPTLTGLKVIVKIDVNPKTHLQSFLSLQNYYQQQYQVSIDEKCKDVTRLMFLSWDESVYINYHSAVWVNPVNEKQGFENMLSWLQTKKGETFSDGNRNDFIYKLSAACFRVGVSKGFTLQKCIELYASEDFTQKEVTTAVNSAYQSKPEAQPKTENSEDKLKKQKENFSLLARVEKYISEKYELRFNEVSLDVEFRTKETNEPFTTLNENNIFRELHHNGISISIGKVNVLLASDFVKPYNPFKDYFEGLGGWQEHAEPDFITTLAGYLPVTDKERFERHFKKMLVRCIACALEDSVFNKQAFILVHSEQNSGKSTFCRWLCPKPLQNYFTENISIDKDSLIALTQNFLINLDELATLSRAEINALKSMFSKDKVKARAPYERKAVTKPRRASFIGSTNKDEFLTDETGSVRFLCFELSDKLNFAYQTEMSVNDVWRQAYALYKSGFHYQLTPEEITENERANRKYQIETTEMQLIQKKFIPSSKEALNADFFTASDVLKEINIENPYVKLNPQAIGRALKLLGFTKDSKYYENTGQSIKGYYLKKIAS